MPQLDLYVLYDQVISFSFFLLIQYITFISFFNVFGNEIKSFFIIYLIFLIKFFYFFIKSKFGDKLYECF